MLGQSYMGLKVLAGTYKNAFKSKNTIKYSYPIDIIKCDILILRLNDIQKVGTSPTTRRSL